ncbi:MAG: hypothetical protein VX081_02855 [Pseudomonadota bacterium]|nr:hypothetical protein [Pseudomonadota bacterium]
MWLSRLIVTAGLLMLSACSSFEIKSLGQALYEQDAVIEVVQASGRNGQLYSRQLRTRLALDSTAATHSVSTTLGVSSSSTLSVQGSSSNLKKKTMTASIRLVDLASGKVVLSDTLSTNATLGTVSSQFAQTTSDRQADERLAVLLADRVAVRLHLFFSQTGS